MAGLLGITLKLRVWLSYVVKNGNNRIKYGMKISFSFRNLSAPLLTRAHKFARRTFLYTDSMILYHILVNSFAALWLSCKVNIVYNVADSEGSNSCRYCIFCKIVSNVDGVSYTRLMQTYKYLMSFR